MPPIYMINCRILIRNDSRLVPALSGLMRVTLSLEPEPEIGGLVRVCVEGRGGLVRVWFDPDEEVFAIHTLPAKMFEES
jgi:hypothetical protein